MGLLTAFAHESNHRAEAGERTPLNMLSICRLQWQ